MRALKRAQDERELAATKEKDIEKLQAEIDDLKSKREELLARIAKYANHNKYLEKVDFFFYLIYSLFSLIFRLLNQLMNFKKFVN
jgi:cell division protein FtsB